MKRFGKYSFWVIAFLFGTGLIAVYKSFDNLSSIREFFHNLINVLKPFIIGFVIAYLLNIPTKKICRFLSKSKFRFIQNKKHQISIFLVYLIAVAIITFAFRMIIPPLSKNIIELCQSMPSYIMSFINYLESLNLAQLPSLDLDKLMSMTQINSFFSNLDLSFVSKYAQGVVGITSNVINIFIGIIISIYMLLDKDRICQYGKVVLSFILKKTKSNKNIDEVCKTLERVNDIFSKFICSQLIDAVIVATLASIVLSILKVRYGLVLGTLLGVCNLIPYFGSMFACVIAIIITLFTGGISQAIWTAIALIVIQQVDGNIIGPKIMGHNLNISPLLVIFAVTFFGGFFGVIGMLIGVPIVAAFAEFFNEFLSKQTVASALQDNNTTNSDEV